MTRVLIVEPSGRLWGSERALLDLVEAASNLEIAVCCPPKTPLVKELAARGVRVIPYFVADLHRKSRWRRLIAAVGVVRACLSFRPDVLHLNQSGAYKVVLPSAVLLRVPIVGHVRIFEDAAYLARQTPSAGRLKALVAISGAIETEIRALPALRHIPLFKVYDAYAEASCKTGGPARKPGRIACVGRLTPIKGQGLLLQAMKQLEASVPAVECLIAGEGEQAHADLLRETAREAGLASIQWLGFVQDVMPLMQTCQVLACPSEREPLGRVIFEAWNAGAVPVAYANAGGAAEIISASQGGVLYHDQTPESLAAALIKALALTEEEAARLIEDGRAWMRAHCDRKVYGEALASIWRQVALTPKAGAAA